MLKENLANVEKNIEQACKNAGRSRDEVTLIAVSKTKPVEMLQKIYDENIRDFGENKVLRTLQQDGAASIRYPLAYDRTSSAQ